MAQAVVDPLMRVWDKDGALRGRLSGEISVSFEEMLNEVGEAKIVLPADHHLAKWSMELATDELFSVTIENPEHTHPEQTRWSGTINTVEYDVGDDGFGTVTWTFVHDIAFMKSILCWSNPESHVWAQMPRQCILVGPSRWVIKQFLFRNLRRIYDPGFKLEAFLEIFDKDKWPERFKNQASVINQYPVFVVPHLFGEDGSEWTVLCSRFTNFYDLVKPTLDEGQFRLKVWRWVPGDPQPAEGWATLNKSTICVDVVDQSGDTDFAVDWFGGLIKTAKGFIDLESRSNAYYYKPWFNPGAADEHNNNNGAGIPVYSTAAHEGFDGLPGAGLTVTKPVAWKVVNGGKSPDWVNDGAKTVINLVFDALSAFLGIPLTAIANWLGKQTEDTLLAFNEMDHPDRKSAMGRFGRPEHWVSTGNEAFSLDGIQAQRVGLFDTRGKLSYKAKVTDKEPFVIGRDFWMGDRVGFQIDKSVWISRVTAVKCQWDRNSDPVWEVTVGDASTYELPEARLLRAIEKVKAGVNALGVEV